MKTVIGLISFNDLHFLEKTLPIIEKLPDSLIIILDNAANDEVEKFIKKEFKKIKYLRSPEGNIGFGKGHNYILEKSPESDYYFCLNTDILINPEGLEECIKFLDKNKDTAIVSGKLYHWDIVKNKKTKIIDTLGIIGNKAHSFWDRGQGKEDQGQYDRTINKIFGISGAAFIIRRVLIEKLAGERGGRSTPERALLFDPNIYLYKEDIDLAYRLRWLKLDVQFLNTILGWHARTLGKGAKKSFFLARMSYKNHLIMLRNNFSSRYSLGTKYLTYLYEFAKFLFYLVTKPKVALELFKVLKIKNLNISKKIADPKSIEKLLLK